MKHYQLILIALFFGLFGCQITKNEIVINGKINGEIPNQVEYSIPIDGISYAGFRNVVIPDSLGNFEITLPVSKPSIMHILIIHQAHGRLVVEPDKKYNVEFNLKSKDKKFIVTGDNQIGQNEFNSLPSRHVQISAKKFLNDTIVTDIEQSIKTSLKYEVSQFNEYLNSGRISNDFYELIILDRECYYATVKGNIASLKYVMDYRFNNGGFTSNVKKMWTRIFEETPVSLSYLSQSQWFFDYITNFIKYNWYTNDSFNRNILSDKYEKGIIHSYYISESKKYLPEELHEFYQACYLYLESIQDSYDKELIQLFEHFKKDFPNSKYERFLKPEITRIVEYYEKLEKELKSENVKFIDNSNYINSLQECISLFEGKMVYVNVWATWCGPCHEEFQHKEELKKLLDSNNIVPVYISIDKEKDSIQWKNMIKFYNLEGFHVRANDKLKAELRKIFDKNGSLSIPWYILIDNNGEILKKHASRPSQIEKLDNELNDIN